MTCRRAPSYDDEFDAPDIQQRIGEAPMRSMRQLAQRPQRLLRDVEIEIEAMLRPLGKTGLLSDQGRRPTKRVP